MRIGELAARAGVTPKAVRYYERLGLIKAARTPSGYRDFDDSSLDAVQTIRNAQRLGVKLAEMNDIVALVRNRQRPCSNVQSIIRAKRREVADRISALMEFDRFLGRLQEIEGPGDAACPILSAVQREHE